MSKTFWLTFLGHDIGILTEHEFPVSQGSLKIREVGNIITLGCKYSQGYKQHKYQQVAELSQTDLRQLRGSVLAKSEKRIFCIYYRSIFSHCD